MYYVYIFRCIIYTPVYEIQSITLQKLKQSMTGFNTKDFPILYFDVKNLKK